MYWHINHNYYYNQLYVSFIIYYLYLLMLRLIVSICTLIMLYWVLYNTSYAAAPKFETEFANYLINKDPLAQGKEDAQEKIFDPAVLGIDRHKGIKQNIIDIFYPQSYQDSGRIRELIKNAIIALMVVFMFLTAFDLLLHTDEDNKIKDTIKKMIFIGFGGMLCFISRWLLAQIGIRWWDNNIQWSAWLFQWLQWQYNGDEGVWLYNQSSGILFDVLNTLKAGAFFLAILMIARYGFQIMRSMDDDGQLTTAKKGIFNIVLALVVMRVIDFIYYIAQSPTFNSQAVNTIITISTYVWYILWALFILVLIYAGIQIIMSNGEDDKITKAKNYVTTMFLIGITILLFLLIIYQIMQEIV